MPGRAGAAVCESPGAVRARRHSPGRVPYKAACSRKQFPPGERPLAKRRVKGGRSPSDLERVLAVLEGSQTGRGRVRRVGVDAGSLDAAFPLVAVNIARERQGERQEKKAERHRPGQDDEQGGGAQRKPLDEVYRDEVEYARAKRQRHKLRDVALKIGLAADVIEDGSKANREREQTEGREDVRRG